MEPKGCSQITCEEAHLFSTGAYKSIKNSKGTLKTEMVFSSVLMSQ